jgi:hypothetical protein
LKEAVLKTVELSRVPWVRIPPPPPKKNVETDIILYVLFCCLEMLINQGFHKGSR